MLMKSSTLSLTEQLSERFAERIRNRLLAPGARLPSVRQCAQQNGVSPSTVVAAYDQLLALGLEKGVTISLLDAHNRIRLIDQPLTIKKKEQYGDYVSLIPHGGAVCGLTLKGMKYPLFGATLTPDVSLGISNEIVDEEASISFQEGRLFVFETRD